MRNGEHPGYPPPTATDGPYNGLRQPSSYGPHPPPYMTTPTMSNHLQPPPPPLQFVHSAHMYGPKRKHIRATQACEQCRRRKQKCDEGTPCSFCKENNESCQYGEAPPAKTDKNMEKLLSYMENHSRSLAELTAKIDRVEGCLKRVEHVQQSQCMSQDHRTSLDDHRTAPHKLLLLWPTVRSLLNDAGVSENDGYVVQAEDRGILQIWTRENGINENDGTQPGIHASPALSDEIGGVSTGGTPYADGLWGLGFPLTPYSDACRPESLWGGLNAHGEIDLDATTIDDLYNSYMRNIHIMHPILERKHIRGMFDHFIQRYGTGRLRDNVAAGSKCPERSIKRQRPNGSTAHATGGPEGDTRCKLTERSPDNAIIWLVLALGKICMHHNHLPPMVQDRKQMTTSGMPEKISKGDFAAHSPLVPTIKAFPMSSKLTTRTQPIPPLVALRAHDVRSRRSPLRSSAPAGARTLDIIPGLAYYAKAAEILGEQADGNDLVHAQMFLLAGLYKGQLARVKESMSWITMAGRAVYTLLDRYKLFSDHYWEAYSEVEERYRNSQSRIKNTHQSLIVIAAWTCLQLESDILAELHLPESGIKQVEHMLLMPHMVLDDESHAGSRPSGRQDDSESTLIYYSAQLFLRRYLNKVHREIYWKESLMTPNHAVGDMLKAHEGLLSAWRKSLPPGLQWDDNDPPPREILPARLRAKYWGAWYLINRPFLDYALHIMPHVRQGERSVESVALNAHGDPRDKADIHLFLAIQKQFSEDQISAAAKRCIHAAMYSTVAFDGVPHHLIVTNIHGTAHAQFGNMLVLSAVYSSTKLNSMVPEARFRQLLERTIAFLRRLAPISPTCKADCGVLEKLQHTIFGPSEDDGLEGKPIYYHEGAEPLLQATSEDSSSDSGS